MSFTADAVAPHVPGATERRCSPCCPSWTHTTVGTVPNPALHASSTLFSQRASCRQSSAVAPPDRNTEPYLAVHVIAASCGVDVYVLVEVEVPEVVPVVVVVGELVAVVEPVVVGVVVAVGVGLVVGVGVPDVVGVLTWHVWKPPRW